MVWINEIPWHEMDVNGEVIMKDVSTVRYEPKRLWEWERIAMEVVQRGL
jgi:hypothetical protein